MIRELQWDSGFFGIGIGAAEHPINGLQGLSELLEELDRRTYEVVYAMIDPVDSSVLNRALKRRGCFLADLRTDMRCRLDRARFPEPPEDVLVRSAEPGDAAAVTGIASVCFRGTTRFYRDPGFDDERCDEMYRIWSERDMTDEDAITLVSIRGGEISGFCTARRQGAEEARLGLIGVSPEYAGAGTGSMLLAGLSDILIHEDCRCLSAVTQLTNGRAVRMYLKAGFLPEGILAAVHFWRGKDPVGV